MKNLLTVVSNATSCLIIGVMILLVLSSKALAAPQSIQLISKSPSGLQTNSSSERPSISGDGRYTVYQSSATNLVANDTNGARDIFVYDSASNQHTRVSVSSTGQQANSFSGRPIISNNGRYVVFDSAATNLDATIIDNSFHSDVFLHDRITGATKLISRATNGSIGNAGSILGQISDDGIFVVFRSDATNLSDNDTNETLDIFIRRLDTNTTTRITNASNGQSANGLSNEPSISCDGRYVVYDSVATNITNDTNTTRDIFIYDRITNTTQNITLQANGNNHAPQISCDGQRIAFVSEATNLVGDDLNVSTDLFIYDRASQLFILSSRNANSNLPTGGIGIGGYTISADGRFVIFNSASASVVPDDQNNAGDVFLRDNLLSTTNILSSTPQGITGNTSSEGGSISGDGTKVSFASISTNLVAGDTNGHQDIFLVETGVINDTQAPVVTGNAATAANSNGWFNTDVLINWLATDPLPSSGSPTQPSPTLASLEGTNTYTSGQSCDPAGNCATGSLALSLDKSLPIVNGSLSIVANNQGWFNQDVVASFSCSDAVSGIASCTGPTTLVEGQNQSVQGIATDLADNSANNTLTGINIDKTLPTIQYVLNATPNAQGWFNQDVNVSYNCSDTLSGILSCTNPQTLSSEGTNLTAMGTATDNADNTSNITTSAINIDKSLPTIGYMLDTPANTYGWHNEDVTVSFGCADTLSGILMCSLPTTLTSEGQGQIVNGLVFDNADNANTNIVTVNIDKTAPLITYSLSESPNQHGWHNQDLTVSFICIDDLSGITTCPTSTILATEGSNQSVTAMTSDKADNGTSVTASGINIDKTTPVITASVSTPPNASGWNDGAVTITFTCSDGLSGIDSCSSPVTVSNEGLNQMIIGTAVDKAGNISTTTVTVSIDKTKPTIVATQTPPANSFGWNNTNVTVSFTCTDALSGIASCSSPVTITTDGQNQSVTGTAVDNAGNSNTVTANVNIDRVLPTTGNLTAQPTVLLFSRRVNVSTVVSDALSGVAKVEYYVDTDPGVGNGNVMNLSGNTATAAVTVNGNPFTNHTIAVRTQDKAGNWSTIRTVTITILF